MDLKIFNYFVPNEEFVAYMRFGNGHINSTLLAITLNKEKYIFQKINHVAFHDIDMLMDNIYIVTEHLKKKGIETLDMIKATNGKYYVQVGEDYYRMYKYMKNTFSFEKPEGVETIHFAATAFGKFHNYLADLDASKLGETIPHFHDTPKRYNDLLNAYQKDVCGRAKDVENEFNIIKKYVDEYSLIQDGLKSGAVKYHITHNDPKINNALFDDVTHKYRSIIDLDTVMPGSVLYDFGDALRSLFTGDKEDSPNYKSVVDDPSIYKEYLRAYYKEAKGFLTEREKELFPYAPFILTMECGIRFLEDYLKGDVYFSTKYPKHNLVRARTQIHLAESIINNIDKYKEITERIINE